MRTILNRTLVRVLLTHVSPGKCPRLRTRPGCSVAVRCHASIAPFRSDTLALSWFGVPSAAPAVRRLFAPPRSRPPLSLPDAGARAMTPSWGRAGPNRWVAKFFQVLDRIRIALHTWGGAPQGPSSATVHGELASAALARTNGMNPRGANNQIRATTNLTTRPVRISRGVPQAVRHRRPKGEEGAGAALHRGRREHLLIRHDAL